MNPMVQIIGVKIGWRCHNPIRKSAENPHKTFRGIEIYLGIRRGPWQTAMSVRHSAQFKGASHIAM
jgi:hypothetical protein